MPDFGSWDSEVGAGEERLGSQRCGIRRYYVGVDCHSAAGSFAHGYVASAVGYYSGRRRFDEVEAKGVGTNWWVVAQGTYCRERSYGPSYSRNLHSCLCRVTD